MAYIRRKIGNSLNWMGLRLMRSKCSGWYGPVARIILLVQPNRWTPLDFAQSKPVLPAIGLYGYNHQTK
jgi:hypothetical protein